MGLAYDIKSPSARPTLGKRLAFAVIGCCVHTTLNQHTAWAPEALVVITTLPLISTMAHGRQSRLIKREPSKCSISKLKLSAT